MCLDINWEKNGEAIPDEIANGTQGRITEITKTQTRIEWKNKAKSFSVLNNLIVQKIDHAYARTSMKSQGETNTIQILAFNKSDSKSLSKEMLYVDVTRARNNPEVVSNHMEDMGKALLRDSTKTSATDFGIEVGNRYQIAANRILQATGLDHVLNNLGSYKKTLENTQTGQNSLLPSNNLLNLDLLRGAKK